MQPYSLHVTSSCYSKQCCYCNVSLLPAACLTIITLKVMILRCLESSEPTQMSYTALLKANNCSSHVPKKLPYYTLDALSLSLPFLYATWPFLYFPMNKYIRIFIVLLASTPSTHLLLSDGGVNTSSSANACSGEGVSFRRKRGSWTGCVLLVHFLQHFEPYPKTILIMRS